MVNYYITSYSNTSSNSGIENLAPILVTEIAAVIDAEKDTLIEMKKQVAKTEDDVLIEDGVIAEGEVNLAKVTVEDMKPDKKAARKAKKEQ